MMAKGVGHDGVESRTTLAKQTLVVVDDCDLGDRCD